MSDPLTRPSLLRRVRDPKDARAWNEFSEIYLPLIRQYVRFSGLPEVDVDDVVQETLLGVYRAMPQFEYEADRPGAFRAYLRQAVRSKLANFYKKSGLRPPHVRLEDGMEPAVDGVGGDVWDQEYNQHLLGILLKRVQADVDDATSWRCFHMYIIERRTAKEVGGEIGIPPGAVATRAWRIMEKLRGAADDLDPDLWPEL